MKINGRMAIYYSYRKPHRTYKLQILSVSPSLQSVKSRSKVGSSFNFKFLNTHLNRVRFSGRRGALAGFSVDANAILGPPQSPAPGVSGRSQWTAQCVTGAN